MMNILNFYEAGKARSGTALIPVANTTRVRSIFSTRNGNSVIDKGDGSAIISYTNPKNVDYSLSTAVSVMLATYATAFSGNIKVKFLQGLKDVYSWSLFVGNADGYQLNIQNLETFLNQFNNLYSLSWALYLGNGATTTSTVIKGDLSKIPNSLEKIRIDNLGGLVNNGTDFYLNLSNFSNASNLKFLNLLAGMKINGDLGKLPVTCSFLHLSSILSGSSITYTAGKVWASSFDTLSIPLALTLSELDNLLIDMNNSITTKMGAGVIYLGGYRSATSDAAVASLQARGFTVNVQRVLNNVSNTDSAILRLDFQNNFDVYSNSAMNIIAGGSSNQPTLALSGRKAGEYCAVFNGSQSIKTTANLPVNSDKVTIAFWMKTTQTAVAIIAELSQNTNANNAFSAYLNDSVANSIQFNSRNTGDNKSVRTGANNGTWKHFVAVIDRSQNGANEILIYENGTLATITKPSSTDNNGNFVNNILFIGQRAGSSAGFNGSLTRLKIYNYPFTAGEVSTLYNSEL